MKQLKYSAFILFGLLILVMIITTVLEKLYGTAFARNIYGSPLFVALWAIATLLAVIYMVKSRLYKRIPAFLIHCAFIVILVGGFITWLAGERGHIHLIINDTVSSFTDSHGKQRNLPFEISLKQFEIAYYPGTQTPMDFISRVAVTDADETVKREISMNNIASFHHYRLYQTSYDKDMNGCTLTVSYDPVGISITYAGYLLLFISFVAFFFDKKSRFRILIKSPSLKQPALIILLVIPLMFSVNTLSADNNSRQDVTAHNTRPNIVASPKSTPAPKVLPKDVAEDFGYLQVLYNGRICPLSTFAKDFTSKLYGKPSYNGYSAEQVLTGWMFYFSDWQQQPMLKIKKQATRERLGTDGKYACLEDFYNAANEYKLEGLNLEDTRVMSDAIEKLGIITMLYSGELLKIYPVADSTGSVQWFAQNNNLPTSLPEDKLIFIMKSMDYIHEKIISKDYDEVKYLVEKTALYQQREAGNASLSPKEIKMETLYNKLDFLRPLFMFCITLGLISFVYNCVCLIRTAKPKRWAKNILLAVVIFIFSYLTLMIALRWHICGHVPLSNGFETMQFMAWCSLLLVMIINRRVFAALPFGLLLCGLTLLVSMLGASNPQITPLMPVLSSPLLCIHVAVIMIAYSLMGFAMLNGVTACVLRTFNKDCDEQLERLAVVSRIILYPAVFLIAIGIFIGAVWANISWGRYWGWDPKETWALITMLVYAAALHTESLPKFRNPLFLHVFTIIAFLSVLITYFGVNFLLGGMHSYA
ncbi:MAG: cytochrome c biogenesis protein CcsA [Bacteroidales bacterium]|nr:cytochrome c biogenesis protein CcsA [Bacteroidales bacterium]